MSDESPAPKKNNRITLLLSVLCASGIASGVTFYIQQQKADQQISDINAKASEQQKLAQKALKEKDDILQLEREAIQKKLSISAEQYQEKYQTTTSELSSNLKEKDQRIASLEKSLSKLSQENSDNKILWKDSLMTSLEISQDVYAMKWQTNNAVLSDMENHSARTLDVAAYTSRPSI